MWAAIQHPSCIIIYTVSPPNQEKKINMFDQARELRGMDGNTMYNKGHYLYRNSSPDSIALL